MKIDTVCDIMTDASRGLPIQRYADVNALILKTQSKTCLDFYYVKLLQEMNQTGWNTSVAKRGGQYTGCMMYFRLQSTFVKIL